MNAILDWRLAISLFELGGLSAPLRRDLRLVAFLVLQAIVMGGLAILAAAASGVALQLVLGDHLRVALLLEGCRLVQCRVAPGRATLSGQLDLVVL